MLPVSADTSALLDVTKSAVDLTQRAASSSTNCSNHNISMRSTLHT
jgi:hypothetical protein